MVPVFETDLSEREIPPAEWRHFELWERIEQRRKAAKRLWVLATLFVSLCLLSIPTVLENRDKWGARAISRELALRLVKMKTEAARLRVPQRIVFAPDGAPSFRIETVKNCVNPDVSPSRYTEALGGTHGESDYRLVRPEQGEGLGIPGLVTSFCYDPVEGSPGLPDDEAAVGFAFISVKDLSQARSDRVSVVLLRGKSAEISFN